MELLWSAGAGFAIGLALISWALHLNGRAARLEKALEAKTRELKETAEQWRSSES